MLRFVRCSALVLIVAAAGCAAPCDRYCDETADYIEFCLENGSQDAWRTAAAAGWSTWGYTGKEEYVSDCKSDIAGQLDASEDTDGFETACTDDANRYGELAERGFCADLP